MKNPKPYLLLITDTLNIIRENTPKDKSAFLNDLNAQDATLIRLQDIGEQLIHIRDKVPEFYEQNDSDDWNKIIGLRNIIAHGYREIDFEIIWNIVENRLDNFHSQIGTLVK
jgi:uncharacterized protein with HEPN domain